jgi:cytochrome c oxidase subunit IV
MITAFVFMMMVIVEYVNIALRGRLGNWVSCGTLRSSSLASFLGATPGCLGAFASVTLYEHGLFTFGALVASMIATSGDEAFVMLSLFPGTFLILMAILFVVGIITSVLVDRFLPPRILNIRGGRCRGLVVHKQADRELVTKPFQRLVDNFSGRGLLRWAMLVVFLTYAVLAASGVVGGEHVVWTRAALVVLSCVCIGATLFGTDHFLKAHVWEHIVRKHLPRVFLWTFGVLFALSVTHQYVDVYQFVQDNRYLMLLVACLVGIIPESGPHFVFVTLFADGALPFSILLANSIVQDGHGMLPLLAFSRRDFLMVKLVNVAVGFALGLILLMIGF